MQRDAKAASTVLARHMGPKYAIISVTCAQLNYTHDSVHLHVCTALPNCTHVQGTSDLLRNKKTRKLVLGCNLAGGHAVRVVCVATHFAPEQLAKCCIDRCPKLWDNDLCGVVIKTDRMSGENSRCAACHSRGHDNAPCESERSFRNHVIQRAWSS